MSEERRARRLRERQQRKEGEKAVIEAARAQGCTCAVKVEWDQPDHPLHRTPGTDGIGLPSVRHDAWCPLLRVMEERPPGIARSQIVIRPDR